jgi:hypothetical protein
VAPLLRRTRVDETQLGQAPQVMGEVLHPNLGLGLRAKDMLDPDPHGGFCSVALLGLFGQWLAPLALAANVAGQLHGFERRFHLRRSISGVPTRPCIMHLKLAHILRMQPLKPQHNRRFWRHYKFGIVKVGLDGPQRI